MANITQPSSVAYAPASNTIVYFVDPATGVHKAKITGISILISATNVPSTTYTIRFENPQLGSTTTPVTNLYPTDTDALAAYQLLIT